MRIILNGILFENGNTVEKVEKEPFYNYFIAKAETNDTFCIEPIGNIEHFGRYVRIRAHRLSENQSHMYGDNYTYTHNTDIVSICFPCTHEEFMYQMKKEVPTFLEKRIVTSTMIPRGKSPKTAYERTHPNP